MTSLYVIPFLLQGLLISIDEFYFHRQRGLPTWEAWGHPLDTFTLILPIGLLAYSPYSDLTLYIYIGLAIFSCVFITKDEFVHTKVCSPMEHWLHSALFVLHPVVFFCAAQLWMKGFQQLLLFQVFALNSFMLYQLLYWGRNASKQHHL